MEWIFLDLAGVSFVKLSISLGEIMFFGRVNGKCHSGMNSSFIDLTASMD